MRPPKQGCSYSPRKTNLESGEAGFDQSEQETKTALEKAERGDISGLLRIARLSEARRKRDSFCLMSTAVLEASSLGEKGTVNQFMELAARCVHRLADKKWKRSGSKPCKLNGSTRRMARSKVQFPKLN